MGRWTIAMAISALLVVIAGIGALPTNGTAAQGEEDDLAATVAALQTQVADLEERVTALEESADDDEPARATRTPEADSADESNEDEDAPLGTRDNPIPLDVTTEVGDYTVRVVDVIPDATDLVLAENPFNEPPAEGRQFFIVTVEVTYRGDTTGSPAFDLNAQLVGERSYIYTTFDDTCGVVPNDAFLTNELGPGGLIRYNLCWSVVSGEVDSLIMLVESFLDFNAEPIYFALREEE